MLVNVGLTAGIVGLAMVLSRREYCVVLAVAIIPALGLVRRLASGGAGRVDFDPLILAPYGVLLVFLLTPSRGRQLRANELVAVLCAVIAASLVVSGVSSYPVSADGLFSMIMHLFCLMLIVVVATGTVADPIRIISKYILVVSVPCAAYSIFQFVYLPSWDRAWMIASGLNSVGSPEPFEVRVFGTSESPGPFALFIGCAIVLAWIRAVSARTIGSAFLLISVIVLLTVSLILTGVRSALLGLAVCAVVAAIRLGRGWQRFVPIASLGLFWVVLGRVLESFSDRSTVIDRDRYSVDSIAYDDSFLDRLDLYAGTLLRPMASPFGNASAPQSDGLLPDFIIRYGYVAGLAISALLVVILVRSWRNLSPGRNVEAGLMAIFICCYAVAGNPFASAFGLIAGLIIGSALSIPIRPQLGEGGPADINDGADAAMFSGFGSMPARIDRGR